MVTLLRIFLILSRPLLFTVLDQLQNQRQLMLSPFSGHWASRLVYMPRHAPTRPLVQARKYLTHDSEVVISSIADDGDTTRACRARRSAERLALQAGDRLYRRRRTRRGHPEIDPSAQAPARSERPQARQPRRRRCGLALISPWLTSITGQLECRPSTLKRHSWPRQRIVWLTRKRSFAPDFRHAKYRLKPTRRLALSPLSDRRCRSLQ